MFFKYLSEVNRNYLSNICGVEVFQLHLGVWIFQSKFNLYGEASRCVMCRKFCPWVQTANTNLVCAAHPSAPEEMIPGKTLQYLCNPPYFSYYRNGGNSFIDRLCYKKIGCFVKSVSSWNIGQRPLFFCFLKAVWCVLSGLHVLKCSEPVVRLRQRWAELNDQFWGKRDIKVV